MTTSNTVGGSTERDDGRRARRERNRVAVVDALLELYSEGNLEPSSDEIATRAGLSARSLFRYFDDIGDLARSALSRQTERLRHLFKIRIDPNWPVGQRIQALVDGRIELFEEMGPLGQVSRLRAPFQPVVAIELRESRAAWREQVRIILAAELEALPPATAEALLSAADILCSYDCYQLMRFDQGFSRQRAGEALVLSLSALFGQVG